MSAVVVAAALVPQLGEDEPLIAVPAAHLARLLDLEAELAYALMYTPAGRSMRPGRVKTLRTIHERKP